MPLFFILSGATFGISELTEFDTLCRKKIRRLLIPYWVYGQLFMLPVKYISGFYSADTFKQAEISYWAGGESGHLWFLTALFWCMLIGWFMICFVGKKSAFLLLIIAYIFQYNHSFITLNVLGMQEGLNYIFWFISGYCFEKVRGQLLENKNLKYCIVKLICLATIIIVDNRYTVLDSFFRVIFNSYFVYVLAVFFNNIFKRGKNKSFQMIVRNTFYIYIFHDPLEYVILKLTFGIDLLSSSGGCYLYLFLRTIGVIIVSIILGECVRLLKKIILKQPVNKGA